MNDFNQLGIEGRLTRDPERKATGNGLTVLRFSIASNRSYKVNDDWKEQVSYFQCVMFGKAADYFAPKLHQRNACPGGRKPGATALGNERRQKDELGPNPR